MTIQARTFVLLAVVWLAMTIRTLPLGAYEFETHEALSVAAFRLSSIGPRLKAQYDIGADDRATDRLPGRLSGFMWTRLTPAEWVAEGGRDEDEPAWRVVNHFYDPFHDRPMTPGLGITQTAPDWALEDRSQSVDQRHSYSDARSSFYAGLTASDRATREENLAHAFYALGHVIHLIQDMAQPQHVRNDIHPTHMPGASFLERYMNFLVERRLFIPTGDLDPETIRQRIGEIRGLWATGTGPTMGRLGLAEFTNANFVSRGTNFTALLDGAPAEGYPSPVLDIADFSRVSSTERCLDGATAAPSGADVLLTFFGNRFDDPVADVELHNPRMTTFSVFDQDLQNRSLPMVFALNCFNYDQVANFLVQRAVSYSAALLDYFFRGRLEARVEQRGQTLGLRVTNRTPGERMENGVLTLVYEDGDGRRFPLATWPLSLLESDTESDFLPFPRPPGPFKGYFLIYRGKLGQEPDAVVGGAVDPMPGWAAWTSLRANLDGVELEFTGSGFSAGPAPPPSGMYVFSTASRGMTAAGERVEDAYRVFLYRALREIPGDRLRLTEFAPLSVGCLQGGDFNENPTYVGPAMVHIVEAKSPASIDEVPAYTFFSPPLFLRTIAIVEARDGMPPFEVDVSGVRTIGWETVTDPPENTACGAYWVFEFVP